MIFVFIDLVLLFDLTGREKTGRKGGRQSEKKKDGRG